MKTFLKVMLAFTILTHATWSPAATAPGGVIHFVGQIVEGANYDPVTKRAVETSAEIPAPLTFKEPVCQNGKLVGETLIISWN
jgi:type 1 fimbria pilin